MVGPPLNCQPHHARGGLAKHSWWISFSPGLDKLMGRKVLVGVAGSPSDTRKCWLVNGETIPVGTCVAIKVGHHPSGHTPLPDTPHHTISSPVTAPTQKSVPLARQNATFLRFYLLHFYLWQTTMPPRILLGIIDGNRQQGGKLTLYQCGKIEGSCNIGSTFAFAVEQVKCHPTIARLTLQLAPEHLDGHTKKRSGRPNAWDSQFEYRVLHFAWYNSKMIYQAIKDYLDTLLFIDILRQILNKNNINNWLSKKQPFFTKAVIKKYYQ